MEGRESTSASAESAPVKVAVSEDPEVCDVLVVGAGAAGISAARALQVTVCSGCAAFVSCCGGAACGAQGSLPRPELALVAEQRRRMCLEQVHPLT